MIKQACNLLSPKDRMNESKVEAVFNNLQCAVRAQTVEKDPHWIRANRNGILKHPGEPLVKKTVRFVELPQ